MTLVGSEYKSTFDSIIKMKNLGYIPADLIVNVSGNTIYTPTDEFVLADSNTAHASADIHIDEDGASWFDGLRGNAVDESAGAWLMFVEAVKNHFHRKYSLVEYCPKEQKISSAEIAKHKTDIRTLLKTFYPDYEFNIVADMSKASKEDIYGASLRMELSDGTGEAIPVLGKVFFKNSNDDIIPYEYEDALQINASLGEFSRQNKGNVSDIKSAEIATIVLNAIDKLVKGEYKNMTSTIERDIRDYIIFTGKEDAEVVKMMVDRGPNEYVEINCQHMTIMSVSHVDWQTNTYSIKIGDKTIFKAIVGMGGRITLYCKLCNDAKALVENSRIYFDYDGEQKCVYLDMAKPNLGMSEEDYMQICESKHFSKHLIRISCEENCRFMGVCTKYLCAKDTILIEGNELKCASCPYPEVVYRCQDGILRSTKNLVFARDRMELVAKGSVVACQCCGRQYTYDTQTKPKNYTCDFCNSMKNWQKMDIEDKSQGVELYRKYSRMLPLILRIKNIGKTKLCKEDEDIILFALDKQIYICHKENLAEGVYLNAPQKTEY